MKGVIGQLAESNANWNPCRIRTNRAFRQLRGAL
jgi:hypothetical protein